MEQLGAIAKGLREMNDEICEAMHIDLGRDLFINFLAEVAYL
jgi:acyl-CoA reductase-like NAD-dependent aldehyde dehydrogenase